MNSITFGELIKDKRKDLGLPLRQVAARIDLDQSTLSKVERNEVIISEKMIPALASCLDLNYENLQIKYLSERILRQFKQMDYAAEALEIAQRKIEQEHTGTNFNLKREKIIENIQNYFQKQPIEKAWLFGSFARKTESYDSDIDILVQFSEPAQIDLFDYVGIKQDLEELTGRQVDLVQKGQELAKIKPIIAQEKVLIYERPKGSN